MTDGGGNGAGIGAPGAGLGAPEAELGPPAPPDRPEPEFEVTGVEAVERSATPTLRFHVRVEDASERPVYAMALSVLITVEPAKRSYDPETRGRLVELFGEPERWATTTTSFRWAQADVLVGDFTGSTSFSVPIPCTYDHEVAATKYFQGLRDGEAPLRLHFNGTVFYEVPDGRIQLLRIPWDRSVRFSMPVSAWHAMVAAHYPYRGWVAMNVETIERLARRKTQRGLPTFDETVARLLDESAEEAP